MTGIGLLIDAVLTTLLSVYNFDNGSELPLPRTDEVLLCTQSTTIEEVFFQLIFSKSLINKKLRCLRTHQDRKCKTICHGIAFLPLIAKDLEIVARIFFQYI